MHEQIKKVLKIPYHRIYIRVSDYYPDRKTKKTMRRLVKSQKWVDGISEIETNYNMNYTVIKWKGKYNNA
jgi:hypothetical protein